MAYNAAKRSLTCEYCGNHLTNIRPFNRAHWYSEQDFTATLPTAKAHRWELADVRTLKCEGCGATFTLPPLQVSGACPFCGSAHLVETQTGELIQPEGVLPFQFDARSRHASSLSTGSTI